MAKKKEERSDDMILTELESFKFPVCGKEIEIKPWSFGKYAKDISPKMEEIFEAIDKSNMDLSSLVVLKSYLSPALTDEEKREFDKLVGAANKAMMRLMGKISLQVMDIIEASTNMKRKDIEELNPTDVFYLCIHMYFLNPTVLGNVFMPFVGIEGEGQ